MADLRYWVRSASRVVYNLKCLWVIKWVDDDTVHMRHVEINKPKFAEYFRDKVMALRKFVQEGILFGIDLAELGILFDFQQEHDSGDEQTWGYSPIGSTNRD